MKNLNLLFAATDGGIIKNALKCCKDCYEDIYVLLPGDKVVINYNEKDGYTFDKVIFKDMNDELIYIQYVINKDAKTITFSMSNIDMRIYLIFKENTIDGEKKIVMTKEYSILTDIRSNLINDPIYFSFPVVVTNFFGISGYKPHPIANYNQEVSMTINVNNGFILSDVLISTLSTNEKIDVLETKIEQSGPDKKYTIKFIMPDDDINISILYNREGTKNIKPIEKRKEENKMKNDTNNNGVIDTFSIPEELAKELSELLTKQIIRERLLLQLIEEPEKYDKQEKMLIPVVSKVEAIKQKITNEYVPDKYATAEYSWNYNGWEIDKNICQIYKN